MALEPTEFDFDFPKQYPEYLKLEGDTRYTDNPLRFTKTDDHDNALPRSMGRAIYIPPVVFKLGHKVANFETEVQFKVTPKENTPYADGLAFFIVPEDYKYPTTPGGNFAIFGHPSIFAVVFDIDSDNPEYIKLGICLNDRTPQQSVQVPVDFLGTDQLKLKVSYNSVTKCISASVSNGNIAIPLTFPHDLSHFLPPKVKVGLGSSTSEFVAVHDAFSWSFKSGADPPATS